jgi:hypothetical protein
MDGLLAALIDNDNTLCIFFVDKKNHRARTHRSGTSQTASEWRKGEVWSARYSASVWRLSRAINC